MKCNVKRHAVVQPQDQSIKLIPLTRGQNAIVDAVDYEWLNQWNWTAMWSEDVANYYAVRKKPGVNRRFLIHRQLLGEHHRQVDHANGNTLDNRRQNLRPCTSSQNIANRRNQKNNKSGFKGVSWHSAAKKFMSCIGVNRRNIYLGVFVTKEDAARAYNEAAIKYFGEFARLNHLPTDVETP